MIEGLLRQLKLPCPPPTVGTRGYWVWHLWRRSELPAPVRVCRRGDSVIIWEWVRKRYSSSAGGGPWIEAITGDYTLPKDQKRVEAHLKRFAR